MSDEVIYLYRRKGQAAWAACEEDRYFELSSKQHLFEVKAARSDRDYAALEERYECNTAIMHARTEALSRVTAERDAFEAECERLNAEGDQLARDLVSLLGVTAERDALAAELAAIRAAGGEQVEVVAYQCGESGRLFSANFSLSKPEPLMRISQHGRIVAAMAAELEKITKQRDAILQQARIWAMEAKTQRSTVLEVGEILGGVPDWGPIAAGVEAMRAELEAARKQGIGGTEDERH